ncbi:MAG TPA: alanine racemase [Candidatus Stackebrandtia excrementipullorum]|nr:alanine racemase [Candidatus Stackebrandtia excrementipullorum]
MRNDVAATRCYEERLDWRMKAVPPSAYGRSLGQWLQSGPRLEHLDTPVATLQEEALEHNITAMARWCHEAGLVHMPHGKTTMSPQLWQRQLDAGAIGITVANAPQLRVARAFDIPNVLVANELVTPSVLAWIDEWNNSGGHVTCFVDSVAGVECMARALHGTATPLDVCIELGDYAARAGVRRREDVDHLAKIVDNTPSLRLAGVAAYEGSVAHDERPESLDRVDALLADVVEAANRLAFDVESPMITAGGSEYFDQVAQHLAPLVQEGATAVMRAGSYVTHDDGLYAKMTPASRDRGGPQLISALHVRGTVLSMPEPGLALVDVGRRDVSFDAGMPVAVDLPDVNVAALNDQHAHLRGAVENLVVGDVVRLGVSHPCTTFDKWSLIPVVDTEGFVVDAVRTYF